MDHMNIVRPLSFSADGLSKSTGEDVSAQTYANSIGALKGDTINWIRFDQLPHWDYLNLLKATGRGPNPDLSRSPLIIIIGYANGLQLWAVQLNGDALELLSLKNGPIRIFNLIPAVFLPFSDSGKEEAYKKARPLAACVEGYGGPEALCTLKSVSLKTGKVYKRRQFMSPIENVVTNASTVLVTFEDKIAAFDAATLDTRFMINSCYCSKSSEIPANPVGLSSDWLAYSDSKLDRSCLSDGGKAGSSDNQSIASTLVGAASSITQAVSEGICGTALKHGSLKRSSHKQSHMSPGVVTVIHMEDAPLEATAFSAKTNGSLVAHFRASSNPLVAMEFSPCGDQLVTADSLGQSFQVYKLVTRPMLSQPSTVHHLYTLTRGLTTALVQGITFVHDGRWVAVCTARGTAHVFPLNPYGGQPTARTHTSSQIVNKESDHMKTLGGGDNIPITSHKDPAPQSSGSGGSSGSQPSSSPGLTPAHSSQPRHHTLQRHSTSPHVAPFPQPVQLEPHVQIRPLRLGGMSMTSIFNATAPSSVSSRSTASEPRRLCRTVAACFAPTRNESVSATDKDLRDNAADRLFLATADGELIEYELQTQANFGQTGAGSQQTAHQRGRSASVKADVPIDVTYTTKAKWTLSRDSSSPSKTYPVQADYLKAISSGADIQSSQPLMKYGGSRDSINFGSRESVMSECSTRSDDLWPAEVETMTYSGPSRRLWVGPQFSFEVYGEEAPAEGRPGSGRGSGLSVGGLHVGGLHSTSSSVFGSDSDREACGTSDSRDSGYHNLETHYPSAIRPVPLSKSHKRPSASSVSDIYFEGRDSFDQSPQTPLLESRFSTAQGSPLMAPSSCPGFLNSPSNSQPQQDLESCLADAMRDLAVDEKVREHGAEELTNEISEECTVLVGSTTSFADQDGITMATTRSANQERFLLDMSLEEGTASSQEIMTAAPILHAVPMSEREDQSRPSKVSEERNVEFRKIIH